MQLPLSRNRILLLIGSSLLVFLLIVGFASFRVLRIRRVPADFLPEKETVALFHGTTEKERNVLARKFPILGGVPRLSDLPDTDIAVLRLPDGSFGWVVFIGGETVKTMNSVLPTDRDGYAIRTSTQKTADLLFPKEHALSSSSSYRALLSSVPTDHARIYLDARLLSANGRNDALLLNAFSSPFLILWNDAGTMHVSMLPSLPLLLPPVAAPAALSPAPSLALAFPSPSSLTFAWSVLPPDTRTVLDGLMRDRWQSVVGPDASLAHGLLPLLGNENQLYASASGGSLRFLVASNARDAQALSANLAALRASARSLLATPAVKHRTLTNGFSAVSVSDDASFIQQQEETVGSWTVGGVLRTDTKQGFWTATSGLQFLLSNDESWLRALLSRRSSSLALPRGDGALLFGGLVSRDALRITIRDAAGFSLPLTLLDAFGPGGNNLLWSLETRGGVVTWSVEGK
jgi:hypothetical protein